MPFLLATLLSVTPIPDEARLTRAVAHAIGDEIQHGILATTRKDMGLYMETVPEDYRIVEGDGSITDKARLREQQAQAWALITRTNALNITITGFELRCGGECALVKTDQRWDRQMLGRDGVSEFNVVTTQMHDERWELRGSRWVQTGIIELGGTTMVDGKPY
jgi:hypothetical protein